MILSKGDNAVIVSRPASDSRIFPEMLAHHLQHWPNIKRALCRLHPQSSVLNCACVVLIEASKSTQVIESDGG